MDFTQENIYKLKEADAYFKRTPLKDIPLPGEKITYDDLTITY